MLTIRPAGPDDAELVARFINVLAKYERLDSRSRPSVERLARDLDPATSPRIWCFIAQSKGTPIGFALCYKAYSTFWTDWFIHLEDFFVSPEARGTGAGFALFWEVARLALEEDVNQVDLEVLRWNDLAIGFYEKLGGEADDEWIRYRFNRDLLTRLVHPS